MVAPLELSIPELARLVRTRQVSPVEIVAASLERIQADRHLNAYATVLWDEAIKAARVAEEEVLRGRIRSALHGLPVALKDNIDTAGIRTTGGSLVFRDRIPSRDAVVWARLRRAGAILVGKTNLHEFGYAGPHPAFGAVHNPHRPGHSPGGSSSGSAVAVAAAHVVAALGTDTGGSVRQPAAFCGVVGLKPSPGLISLRGVLPLSWTLDTVGLLTKDVDDALIMMDVMVGEGWRRRKKAAPRYEPRIGLVQAQPKAPISEPIQEALDAAAEKLIRQGARVSPVELPCLDSLHQVHRIILAAEAFTAHRVSLEKALDQYGPELRAALLSGGLLRAVDYLAAQQARTYYSRQVLNVLKQHDLLLLPTVSTVAPPLDPANGRPISRFDLTRWTFVANFVGLPAVSVPVGWSDGLPVGLQFMGPRKSEALLLQAAKAICAPAPVQGKRAESSR